MSVKLDKQVQQTGTRFNVFAQPRFLPSFTQPETIYISTPPSEIQPGPADARMFVVDAIGKQPFDDGETPPYNGPRNPPVPPENGHFDHLQPGTREFSCAHMYAVVRRTLDIWEDYFGHGIPWHFEVDFERLLMIPLIRWDNAQSGYGFLEFGFGRTRDGLDLENPYCENFDVLAHELGHSIIFSQVGFPSSEQALTDFYGGFHESAGDLTSLVASLHFESVIAILLEETRGNLFTRNELERVGELKDSSQIREAFNDLRLVDVGLEPHDLSEPLTGGFFDVFVEMFQKGLVARGLISQDLADRSYNEGNSRADDAGIQAEFDLAYAGQERAFADALREARDYWGRLLAGTWSRISPNHLTYGKVVSAALAVDRAIDSGRNVETIRSCFAWRKITQRDTPLARRTHRCAVQLTQAQPSWLPVGERPVSSRPGARAAE